MTSSTSLPSQTRDPRTATMLYKILTPSGYDSLPRGKEDRWQGVSIDLSDHFIHLSTSTQLPGTLSRFFSPDSLVGDTLWICGCARSQLEDSKNGTRRLQWDSTGDGSVFGHVYGYIIPSQDFSTETKISRDPSSGLFHLPEDLPF